MEKIIATKHLKEDRMDRAVFIGTTIGFGEIVEEFLVPARNHYECVTTTGVIIIKGMDKKTIITMYIARLNQITKLYGNREVPRALKIVAKNNEKHRMMEKSEQFKM